MEALRTTVLVEEDILTAAIASESVDLCYLDPPFSTGRDFDGYSDKWDGVDAYVDYMIPRIGRCWDALTPNGNLILHLDWHAVHYLKVAVDRAVGIERFKNEIIWRYNSGGASKRHLSRKHDTLLWWAKGPNYVFNVQREPYATTGTAGRDGFHPDGRMLTDVWEIPFISTTSSERCGWPTQKPLALLERVITIFSDPGQCVLDGFCGSGTTGVAAHLAGRDSVLVDVSGEALTKAYERLSAVGANIWNRTYSVQP
jgi:site-specific DNA-methyltransferase (adenine-specific)